VDDDDAVGSTVEGYVYLLVMTFGGEPRWSTTL
jgi:hypothetical protein